MVMYAFVKLWSVSIHDRNSLVENWFVNGASHHDIHHRKYNFNYGQYFTIWDRIGSSHLEADLSGGDADALSPAVRAASGGGKTSEQQTPEPKKEHETVAAPQDAAASPGRPITRSASKKQR